MSGLKSEALDANKVVCDWLEPRAVASTAQLPLLTSNVGITDRKYALKPWCRPWIR